MVCVQQYDILINFSIVDTIDKGTGRGRWGRERYLRGWEDVLGKLVEGIKKSNENFLRLFIFKKKARIGDVTRVFFTFLFDARIYFVWFGGNFGSCLHFSFCYGKRKAEERWGRKSKNNER